MRRTALKTIRGTGQAVEKPVCQGSCKCLTRQR